MIKYIALKEAVTIPGRISTITTWNHSEHGKLIRVEENPDGFTFIVGTIDEKNQWQPTGDIVEVYRHMVKQVLRVRKDVGQPKEQRK